MFMNISRNTHIDYKTGELTGSDISEKQTTIGQMTGFFLDETSRKRMNPDTVVYRVQTHTATQEDAGPGALNYGTTFLYPGMVGDEYFMTKGHFHISPAAEYYWCIRGRGLLLLMDRRDGHHTIEMSPGTLHYIPQKYAHRVVNTGDEPLVFGACWPADAGHDYLTILNHGFSCRILKEKEKGKPVIVLRS